MCTTSQPITDFVCELYLATGHKRDVADWQPMLLTQRGQAPCAHEVRTIVRIVEITERHDAARARCVNEFTVARVDAHVIHAPRGSPEKHEVSGGQVIP